MEPTVTDPFEGAQVLELSFRDPDALAGRYEDTHYGYADYDGDGVDDVVISYRWEIGTAPVIEERLAAHRFAPEDARLQPLFEFVVEAPIGPIAPGHVDGDGRTDVLHRGSGPSLAQIAIRTDAVEVGPSVEFDGGLFGSLLDFDGDGRTDYLSRTGSSIRVHTVDGQGGWLTGSPLELGCDPTGDATWADLDGDGRLELVLVAVCEERLVAMTFAQADDMTFSVITEHPLPGGSQVGPVGLADFDADGVLDLAVNSAPGGEVYPDRFVVWPGLGDGRFGPVLAEVRQEFPYVTTVFAADLDGDGVDDPVVPNSMLLEDIEDHAMVAVRVVDGEWVGYRVPHDGRPDAVADLDGDGCDELIYEYADLIEVVTPRCP